ncbi:MAG: hypothetical protein R6V13_03395 [Anaerolineae bacterium]
MTEEQGPTYKEEKALPGEAYPDGLEGGEIPFVARLRDSAGSQLETRLVQAWILLVQSDVHSGKAYSEERVGYDPKSASR